MRLRLCSNVRSLSNVAKPGISDIIASSPICESLFIDRREVSGYVQRHGRLAARISPSANAPPFREETLRNDSEW